MFARLRVDLVGYIDAHDAAARDVRSKADRDAAWSAAYVKDALAWLETGEQEGSVLLGGAGSVVGCYCAVVALLVCR